MLCTSLTLTVGTLQLCDTVISFLTSSYTSMGHHNGMVLNDPQLIANIFWEKKWFLCLIFSHSSLHNLCLVQGDCLNRRVADHNYFVFCKIFLSQFNNYYNMLEHVSSHCRNIGPTVHNTTHMHRHPLDIYICTVWFTPPIMYLYLARFISSIRLV